MRVRLNLFLILDLVVARRRRCRSDIVCLASLGTDWAPLPSALRLNSRYRLINLTHAHLHV